MAYWKFVYAALQLIAYFLPFLQTGKGVDMRPIADLERMRNLRKEMLNLNSSDTVEGTKSKRKFR